MNTPDRKTRFKQIFEHIRTDTNLSVPLRTALSRLQPALAKVAASDSSFFESQNHPARILLSELSKASIQIDPRNPQDSLRVKVEQVIEQVVSGVSESSLFQTLLEEFQNFLSVEQKRANLTESREIRAVEGKERLELARMQVANDLESRISQRGLLPAGFRQFLEEVWRHYLLLAYVDLKSGKYAAGLKLLDDLFWSIEPKLSRKEKDELLARAQSLLKALEEALKDGFIVTETQRFVLIREIQSYQMTALRGKEPVTIESVTPLFMRSHTSVTQTRTTPLVPKLVVEDKHVQHVKKLTIGTWFDLRCEEIPRRVKLAWRSPETGRCLFVNRRGIAMCELSLEEFSALARRGGVQVLETTPPFN
ncbi:hypothetical protein CCP3SC1AL1_2390002 [Gammaproteobacteria bacterium]